MFKFFKKRIKEPSSWAGLGALIGGLGMLLKANGVPEVGQAITQQSDQLASGDYTTALPLIIGGLMATLIKEKN